MGLGVWFRPTFVVRNYIGWEFGLEETFLQQAGWGKHTCSVGECILHPGLQELPEMKGTDPEFTTKINLEKSPNTWGREVPWTLSQQEKQTTGSTCKDTDIRIIGYRLENRNVEKCKHDRWEWELTRYGKAQGTPNMSLTEIPGETHKNGGDIIIGENGPKFSRSDKRHKSSGLGSITNLKHNTCKEFNTPIYYE